jgi:hypothetical protein
MTLNLFLSLHNFFSMTLWSVEAFFVIPLGALCLVLLLSDIKRFQKISLAICSIPISLGSIQITLSFVFAIFATCVFVFQTVATLGSEKASLPPTSTVEMADRLRMKEWRNDRNWWISLFACTIWLLCWRIQIWTKRYCLVAPAEPSHRPASPKTKPLKKND